MQLNKDKCFLDSSSNSGSLYFFDLLTPLVTIRSILPSDDGAQPRPVR